MTFRLDQLNRRQAITAAAAAVAAPALLPATAFAMSAAAGDIYYGLWYPIAIAAMTLIIGTLFVKDTLGTNLNAKD